MPWGAAVTVVVVIKSVLNNSNKKGQRKGRAKLAGKSQNLSLIHGRGDLRSPAGDRRSPLRIKKAPQ